MTNKNLSELPLTSPREDEFNKLVLQNKKALKRANSERDDLERKSKIPVRRLKSLRLEKINSKERGEHIDGFSQERVGPNACSSVKDLRRISKLRPLNKVSSGVRLSPVRGQPLSKVDGLENINPLDKSVLPPVRKMIKLGDDDLIDQNSYHGMNDAESNPQNNTDKHNSFEHHPSIVRKKTKSEKKKKLKKQKKIEKDPMGVDQNANNSTSESAKNSVGASGSESDIPDQLSPIANELIAENIENMLEIIVLDMEGHNHQVENGIGNAVEVNNTGNNEEADVMPQGEQQDEIFAMDIDNVDNISQDALVDDMAAYLVPVPPGDVVCHDMVSGNTSDEITENIASSSLQSGYLESPAQPSSDITKERKQSGDDIPFSHSAHGTECLEKRETPPNSPEPGSQDVLNVSSHEEIYLLASSLSAQLSKLTVGKETQKVTFACLDNIKEGESVIYGNGETSKENVLEGITKGNKDTVLEEPQDSTSHSADLNKNVGASSSGKRLKGHIAFKIDQNKDEVENVLKASEKEEIHLACDSTIGSENYGEVLKFKKKEENIKYEDGRQERVSKTGILQTKNSNLRNDEVKNKRLCCVSTNKHVMMSPPYSPVKSEGLTTYYTASEVNKWKC